MSDTICAFDHREWDEKGLLDYGEFSERTHDRNVRDLGDGSAGDWFYADDAKGVIYFGTWGNYNSPGASTYTHAELFDLNDPDDAAEYQKRKAEWESAPEYIDDDDDDDDEGEEDD